MFFWLGLDALFKLVAVIMFCHGFRFGSNSMFLGAFFVLAVSAYPNYYWLKDCIRRRRVLKMKQVKKMQAWVRGEEMSDD